MTQNLDLDLISNTNAENYVALTSENTDLNVFGSDNYDTANSNGYSCSNPSTTTNCTADGEVITWVPSSATLASSAYSSWSINNYAPQSFDYGEQYRWVSTTGSTTQYTTTLACETAHPDGSCPHYHVGNYYNWTAAVASNSTTGITTARKVMGNSICPAGWRLPDGVTSTTTTDPGYYSDANYTWKSEGIAVNYVNGTGTATYETNGWINARNNPLYIVAAGYKSGTSAPSSVGTYARFWTSTISTSSTSSYDPYLYSSNIYPASTYARSGGLSIRCIARQENTGHTTITYDKNANDATGNTGINNEQTINANALTTLTANGFSRSGYAFNSWNTEPDGTGTTYTDEGQYYAITGTAENTLTLYAQWDKLYTITFNLAGGASKIIFDGTEYTNGQTVQAVENRTYSIAGDYNTKYGFYSWGATAGTIANQYPTTTFTVPSSVATITLTGQEATVNMSTLAVSTDPVSSNCENEAITPILVYDPRDNEAYWVARLCDGNYWMLDNLRLDLTNSTVINNLSTSNTNADAASLTSLKSGNRANGDQYATAGLSGSNWTSGYSYSEPMVNVSGSVTAGTNSNTWTGNYTKDTIAPVTYGLGSGKIGVYYNYCAASAGSYCYGEGTSYAGSPNTDVKENTCYDIDGDICPSGWRMPTSEHSGGDFNYLYVNYQKATIGSGEAFVNAFSLVHSGRNQEGLPYQLGLIGDFWSSTWAIKNSYNYSDNMKFANISLENAAIYGISSRRYGFSIRCVSYDTSMITVNFAGTGVESVVFRDNNGEVSVASSGSTVLLQRSKKYQIFGYYTTKNSFKSWAATSGIFEDDNSPATYYTVTGDAVVTLTAQEATTDITTLVASTDPVSDNCKNEAITPILTYDPRDNEAYWVARLCDGNYWMLDNLRLDLTNSTVINSLTTSNTNADADSLTSLKSGNRANGDQYATAGLSGSNWTNGTSYSEPMVKIMGGINEWKKEEYNLRLYTKDTVSLAIHGLGSGMMGVYYNYCAASAGSYCYGDGTTTSGSPTSDPNTTISPTARDITGDICPKGWHMPTGGSYNATTGGGEFQNLYNKYSGATIGLPEAFLNALSIPKSYAHATSISYSGFSFWTSTWSSTDKMLDRRGSTYGPNGASVRTTGLIVRCLLDS